VLVETITESPVMDQPLFRLPAYDPVEQPDFVTALARGLAVIRAFGVHSNRMSLAEIARQVELPRATVRRSLITLETLGYVETDGKTFMLTPQVLSLGHSYLTSLR
jgi:IclR family pca regulon transcriptional regulator